jgi:hypothetical protein
MTKQLIMENYVDECLDEVEIRELYVVNEFDNPFAKFNKMILDKIDDVALNRMSKMLGIDRYPPATERNIKRLAVYKPLTDKQIQIKRKELQRAKEILAQSIKNNNNVNIHYLYPILGTIAVVSIIAYGSYKLYKRFMSKAAKACQDKKGKVKTICMNQYQIKGLEASKKPLADGVRSCSKAKDVQSCKVKFNKKINTIDKKITKKQNQIKKLMSK